MTTTEQTLPTGTWTLDAIHSRVAFAIRHAGVGTFRGHFSDVSAQLADGVLTGAVKVDSIEVGMEKFKEHLLGPDFFDAEHHPDITFRATAVDVDGDGATVTGALTLKGVTRTVTGRGEVAGPAAYLDGKERIGLTLETIIDRADFGITWNVELPGGGQAVGTAVTITVDLELVA